MNTPINFRVGEGWDVHALVPGRPLVIGGVTIPHPVGLLGHSDADVLLHAITDALLGAAALGDIGAHFPDTDPVFRGADSLRLLAEAVRRVRQEGWKVGNIDCTVVAQAPRMAPYREAMRDAMPGLGIDPGGQREGQDR
jgi:2-C-methyl-D-erythritol 2,4-cyclodiphosphate synthase